MSNFDFDISKVITSLQLGVDVKHSFFLERRCGFNSHHLIQRTAGVASESWTLNESFTVMLFPPSLTKKMSKSKFDKKNRDPPHGRLRLAKQNEGQKIISNYPALEM